MAKRADIDAAFQSTVEELRNEFTIALLALQRALINKGLLTLEEMKRAHSELIAEMKQVERAHSEATAEMKPVAEPYPITSGIAAVQYPCPEPLKEFVKAWQTVKKAGFAPGGVAAGEFNDANQQHLTNVNAVVRLLIDKGIVTPEEFSRAHMQATSEIDQVYAAHRESVIRQMIGLPRLDEEDEEEEGEEEGDETD